MEFTWNKQIIINIFSVQFKFTMKKKKLQQQ